MSPKPNPLTRGKKQKALALLRHNQPVEAIPLLEQACRIDRRDIEAWFMLATAHHKLGAFKQAADAYRQIIVLKPNDVDTHYYLGAVYRELGQFDKAGVHLNEAIRLKPDFLEAHNDLGALYEQSVDYSRAAECYRRAAHLGPRQSKLHYNLGNALLGLGQYDQAEQCFRQAIEHEPDFTDAHNNLGNALKAVARFDEAISSYRRALDLNPRYADAAYNLGLVYDQMGDFDKAIDWYQRALAINPRNASAPYNLANNLALRGRLDEAIEAYRTALAISPGYTEAHVNLAYTLSRAGRPEEAVTIYRHVLGVAPDHARAHLNLSLVLLLQGNFKEGWREYQWQWQHKGAKYAASPLSSWSGSGPLQQAIFLQGDQGLGDHLFFLRFAAELKRRGAKRITFCTNPKITTILSRVPAIDALMPPDAAPQTDELIFSISDLPRLLGMERMDQIPSPLPLVPLPEKLDSLRVRLAELGPPPYVGVTWRAGIAGKELVLYKECPLHDLARSLKDVPGTILILQRQPQPGEIESFAQELGRPVHDFTAFNDDLEQMLALMALIDEYVGVSNTNMHLRAGVGKTARVLVPSPPEWRWMAEGKESPWFPGFSVYRQGYDGDWGDAITKLTADLQNPQGLR